MCGLWCLVQQEGEQHPQLQSASSVQQHYTRTERNINDTRKNNINNAKNKNEQPD
eukprot:m.704651 g.704651  ORF g.704651 m.704651 type:complete len:55 (-) comp58718_c0_seq1:122-286(-)